MLTRRELLQTAVAAGVAWSNGSLLGTGRYDLLIKGGRVIDPARRVDRVADVAIAGDRIAAVESRIDPSTAVRVLDASGRLVVPGLIDIHTHARSKEMPSICLSNGVTSIVDAGSQGADLIDSVVDTARSAPNHVRILINIAKTGIRTDGELMDISHADVMAARQAIQRHRDVIIGVKARLSRSVAGTNDIEAVKRAQDAVRPFNLPVMVHVGDTASPLPAILSELKSGDIVTHVYSPPPHGIFDDAGRLLPEVRAARRRGIRFDIGNGRIAHITWDVAEKAIRAGFLPDTISTDWTDAGRIEQVFDFPNVLSKFLLLGMPIDQVIARATINAARTFPAFEDLGTLRVGAPADVAVLERREGRFEFVDNANTTRTGRHKLFTAATVIGGKQLPRS
ncbi:MAG TPA: amidohydrolase/deacetylase family metallohydrolase [Vicinamibacterales bacterium]|nr:amidohydrolase/deacetylase family metallohydrolase [Vicinamibacterales bacterium]